MPIRSRAHRLGRPVRAARRADAARNGNCRILANGSQIALRHTMKSLNGWLEVARPIFEHSLALEMLSFMDEDAAEGIAAVRERRVPVFPSAKRLRSED